MESCLRSCGSFLLENIFHSTDWCKVIVNGNTPKQALAEEEGPSEAWERRLALERESRAICWRLRYDAIGDRVVALPRDGGGATVVCREAASEEIHEFLARTQSRMGISVIGIEHSNLTVEEGIEATRRSVIVALHRGGWRELGDDVLLKSDFLSAPPAETSECMAVGIEVCSLDGGGGDLVVIVRSGVVRFRPWSLQHALENVNRELAAEFHAHPDFWRDPALVGRLNSFLRGVKCTVLPDCRPASICSVRMEHPSLDNFWLDNCGYQLPGGIPYYIDVTFDMEQCDDEAAITIPSCCAWSPSGLSRVNSKSRCGGDEKIMEELKSDLTNVQSELWGGGGLKLIEHDKRMDTLKATQQEVAPNSSHFEENVPIIDWCSASEIQNHGNLSEFPARVGGEGKMRQFPLVDQRCGRLERGSVKVGRISWKCQRRLGSWVKTSALVDRDEYQSKQTGTFAKTAKPILLGRRKGGVPCRGGVSAGEKHRAPHILKRTLQQRSQQEVSKTGNESNMPKKKAFGVIPKSSASSRKPEKKPPVEKSKNPVVQPGPGPEKEKVEMGMSSSKTAKGGAALCGGKPRKPKRSVPDEKGGPLADANLMPPPKRRAKAGDLDPIFIEGKVKELVEAGKKLGGLSVPEMKCFLKSKRLPVGGKKAILQDRILEFLAKEVEL